MHFFHVLHLSTITATLALRLQTEFSKGSPYDFSNSDQWNNADFERKWAMFKWAVPLAKLQANFDPKEDIGPVCHPSLVGPEDSDKLVILLHGFLSCPGLWYRLVPRLVNNGFRVMLPTLPGHGRAWRVPIDSGPLNKTFVDLGEGPITNGSDIEIDLSNAQDDIDDIPTDAAPYKIFAETLGQLATQFKLDHPGGIVAVAGHSLGGAITARYAMDIPDVIDRVMLMNPMFGLASGWISTILSLTPNMLLSKGKKCEDQRGKGSGGTCQFKLANVKAMTEFAHDTLCRHWGIVSDSDCIVNGHKRFGEMQDIQVVSTESESSVDNGKIAKFVAVVQKGRVEYKPQSLNEYQDEPLESILCHWPSDLGHSYISNRRSTSSEKWWHPYVEKVSVDFLSTGRNIDYVKTGSSNDCMLRPSDVEGEYLSLLPAGQHDQYNIGIPRGGRSVAKVLHVGWTEKESHTWGKMHTRYTELITYYSYYLLVTRRFKNDDVRDIYVIRKEAEIPLSAGACMKLSLDDARTDIPLGEAIVKADVLHRRGYSPRTLKFCGMDFLCVLCKKLGKCRGTHLAPCIFQKRVEDAIGDMPLS